MMPNHYITKTFSASAKSNTSLVLGHVTLPSFESAIAVNAYNTQTDSIASMCIV